LGVEGWGSLIRGARPGGEINIGNIKREKGIKHIIYKHI
jgi:hypothetical protein